MHAEADGRLLSGTNIHAQLGPASAADREFTSFPPEPVAIRLETAPLPRFARGAANPVATGAVSAKAGSLPSDIGRRKPVVMGTRNPFRQPPITDSASWYS